MQISSSTIDGRSVRRPREPRVHGFWKDRADDVRELLLLVDQEKLEDAGKLLKSVGSGLKGAWKQVRDIPSKLFDLPVVADKVGLDTQNTLVRIGESLGLTVGFVAAGGHALGGSLKVLSGHQQRETSRKLDGIMDIATAASLTATVAGFGGARAILAPLAAAFNIFRGGHNAAKGYKRNDERAQLQGTLDAVRSAGSLGRLLKKHAMFFRVAGIALAPVAGAIQAGRGLHNLSVGLKNSDNKRELNGLVDIATAVGTALAFASGAAVIPGVALAVAANIAKIVYQVSPKARKKMDRWLDRCEPTLERMVDAAEKLSQPVQRAWKKLMSKLIKQTEEEGPAKFTSAQLQEIHRLLRCDGEYTRQEERRLRVVLSERGQLSHLPTRGNSPSTTLRQELLTGLPSPAERVEFLRFLETVSRFDNLTTQPELDYIKDLATFLEVEWPPTDGDSLNET